MTLTAAEQYAALTAVEQAAKKRKATLVEAVLEEYRTSHARDWATPYGGVMIKNVEASRSISVADHDALLAWVQQWAPTEVETIVTDPVTRVRPAFVTQLLNRLVVEDHEETDGTPVEIVVDTQTAERIDWARILPPAAPTVSMHGGKDESALLTRLNAEKLIDDGLLDLLPAGGRA